MWLFVILDHAAIGTRHYRHIMDPFSATASAIAVIQIAEEVWTLLQNYTLAVKDARKDIQRLSAEVLALHGILERVEDLKNQPGSAQLKTLDLLANLGGPIAQCLGDLKDLASKLRPGHGPTAMNRAGWRALKWPFTSKDIDKKILFLERYKTTFTLALSTDNTCVFSPWTSCLLSRIGLL